MSAHVDALVAAAASGLVSGCVAGQSTPQRQDVYAALVTVQHRDAQIDQQPLADPPSQRAPRTPEPRSDANCCKGMNECKGRGMCKTDANDCKGKNECKGQGGCQPADCG